MPHFLLSIVVIIKIVFFLLFLAVVVRDDWEKLMMKPIHRHLISIWASALHRRTLARSLGFDLDVFHPAAAAAKRSSEPETLPLLLVSFFTIPRIRVSIPGMTYLLLFPHPSKKRRDFFFYFQIIEMYSLTYICYSYLLSRRWRCASFF